jgi:hypothetical protein
MATGRSRPRPGNNSTIAARSQSSSPCSGCPPGGRSASCPPRPPLAPSLDPHLVEPQATPRPTALACPVTIEIHIIVFLARRQSPTRLPPRHGQIGHHQQPPGASGAPSSGWIFLRSTSSQNQTQNRPYGTPCAHEHACIRCPMHRVELRQRTRLVEIARNLREARRGGHHPLDQTRPAVHSLVGPQSRGLPAYHCWRADSNRSGGVAMPADPAVASRSSARRLGRSPPTRTVAGSSIGSSTCSRNFPDHVFAFDEFGPLRIRPTGGACWAETGKPDQVAATYHRTHSVTYFHGCYSIGDDTPGDQPSTERRSHHSRRAQVDLRGSPSTVLRSTSSWTTCPPRTGTRDPWLGQAQQGQAVLHPHQRLLGQPPSRRTSGHYGSSPSPTRNTRNTLPRPAPCTPTSAGATSTPDTPTSSPPNDVNTPA